MVFHDWTAWEKQAYEYFFKKFALGNHYKRKRRCQKYLIKQIMPKKLSSNFLWNVIGGITIGFFPESFTSEVNILLHKLICCL